MKNIFLFAAIFFLGVINAQDLIPNTKVEKVGDHLVKVTTFHDNGQIAQTGFVKNNKLEGAWESYDTNGEKVSIGTYENGQKVGQWFFWNEDQLTEVLFEENKVSAVNLWKDSKSKMASK
jgi:antitoxin component YwqK of YwqJK toxin-antitoxin module